MNRNGADFSSLCDSAIMAELLIDSAHEENSIVHINPLKINEIRTIMIVLCCQFFARCFIEYLPLYRVSESFSWSLFLSKSNAEQGVRQALA